MIVMQKLYWKSLGIRN